METDDPRRPRPGETAADLGALARDWITIWQSELAAAAADRELQEGWQTLAALWAAAATAVVQSWPQSGGDDRGGWPGAAAPPRAAPAAAAPDPRDAEIERLRRRIDALEQRLAALDGSGGVPGRTGT